MNSWRVIEGDCRDVLGTLDAGSVQTCVTSPPYFGLRDYGHDCQIGLEAAPDEFVAALVGVFREVRRVLRDDGTVWLNLGDSYVGSGMTGGTNSKESSAKRVERMFHGNRRDTVPGMKPKDLIGIPWMVAFALRADGWYLRSDIIWAKPNPMPESVTDRPTKAHEYVFLLSKSPSYYYDADAIKDQATNQEPMRPQRRRALELAEQHGLTAKHLAAIRACGVADAGKAQVTQDGHGKNDPAVQALADEAKAALGGYYREFLIPDRRNKRSVWTVPTMPYAGAHFATFPPKLIEPCILAGCPEGGTVLDPFAGAGTTGMVALRHNRSFVGIELNPEYVDLARARVRDDAPLLNTYAEAA